MPKTLKASNKDHAAFFMGNPKLLIILALSNCLLFLAISITSLFYSDMIYPLSELFLAFWPTNIANLALGLPFFALAFILLLRKKNMGLLFLCGWFFFLFYTYTMYLFGQHYNFLFLPYILMIVFSLCGFFYLIYHFNGLLFREKLQGRVFEYWQGIVLTLLGVFLLLRTVGLHIEALQTGINPGRLDLALWIADFGEAVPLLLLSGIFILLKKPLGYLLAPAILSAYTILCLCLVPVLIIQAQFQEKALPIIDLIVVIMMALICLLPLLFFLSGMRKAFKIKNQLSE